MHASPVGTERTIVINTNDGLTGLAPFATSRGARMKDNAVRVDEQARADGKRRVAALRTRQLPRTLLSALMPPRPRVRRLALPRAQRVW